MSSTKHIVVEWLTDLIHTMDRADLFDENDIDDNADELIALIFDRDGER